MWFPTIVFMLSASTSAPPSVEPPCRAAVLDLAPGEGISVERARALTEVVTGEVGAHLDCAVLSRAEIEAMMNFEVGRQAGGCDTDSCLAELGEALGVSRLVLGTIQQVDDDVLISLRLVDMQSARVLRRVTDATHRQEALLPFVGWLARRLVLGDARAGERPVDDTRVMQRQMSGWRLGAFAGVFGGAAILGLAGASGLASVGANEALTGLKTARVTDAARVAALEEAGPWLAGGANLGLYVGAGLVVVGGLLFLLPGEQLVEEPAR
jgi:hypothetical protein